MVAAYFFKLCFFAAFSSLVSQVDLPCDLDQFVLDSDIKFFFVRHLADLRSFEILRKPKFQKRRGARLVKNGQWRSSVIKNKPAPLAAVKKYEANHLVLRK